MTDQDVGASDARREPQMTQRDPLNVQEATLDGLQETIEDDLRGLAGGMNESGLLVKISLASAVSCVRTRFNRARASALRDSRAHAEPPAPKRPTFPPNRVI